jgi:DNA gyrase subunit A
MATRLGEIKKTSLADFANVRRSGLIAMDLEPKDELCWVKHCPGGADVMVVTEKGQALRFGVDALRAASRTSGGVRSIKLAPGDRVAGMDIVHPKGELIIVTKSGFGKRTRVSEYQPHGRGTGGVKTLTITAKTGPVCTIRSAHGAEELMLISMSGIVIRTQLSTISRQGRAAQGVTLMNLKPGDRVATVALLDGEDEGDVPPEELGTPTTKGKGSKATGAGGRKPAAKKPEK